MNNETPSNSVLLEKIINLGGIVKNLCRENSDSHREIISRQDKTNGRVKKCELFYAGIIGAGSAMACVWTVITFLL